MITDSFSDYHVPNVEKKDFNVLIDRKSFFDLPVKNEEEVYKRFIDISNDNVYTTGNLLNIVQTKLKDPQQISFIGKLSNRHGATMFFITVKSKETTFNFSQNSATII